MAHKFGTDAYKKQIAKAVTDHWKGKDRSCKKGCTCKKHKINANAEKFIAEFESYGFTLLEPYKGASGKYKVLHDKCKQEDFVYLYNCRMSPLESKGCSYCAKTRVSPKRLSQEYVEKVFLERNLKLKSVYEGKDAPTLAECLTCGKEVTPRYGDVRDGHGCVGCNKGAYTPHPTVLYLAKHSDLKALQIGITSTENQTRHNNKRLNHHKKQGWKLVKTWDFPTGQPAYETEQKILKHWRKELNAPAFLTKKQMPQCGHTETVSMRKVGLKKTTDYIDELIAA